MLAGKPPSNAMREQTLESGNRMLLINPYRHGGGGGFTPASLTGLELWLDFSDASTVFSDAGVTLASNNDTIQQVNDKSGNARHASQANPSFRPTFKTAFQNSLSVSDFGGSALLTSGSTSTWNFLHNGTNSLVFAVVKFGNSDTTNVRYSVCGTNGFSGSNTGYLLLFNDLSVNNGLQSFYTGGVQVSSNLSSAGACSPNTWVLLEDEADADNATAADRSKIQVNGGAVIANNSSSGTASTGNSTFALAIGADGASRNLVGQIGELIICSNPNTSFRSDLRTYAANKWGISI